MEVISELWQEEKGKSQKAMTLPINSFHRQRGEDIFFLFSILACTFQNALRIQVYLESYL